MWIREAKSVMTVYISLCLLLMLSLMMTLLESARVRGLRLDAELVSQAGIHSIYGEYQEELYDSYGILAIDGAYGRENFSIANVEGHLEKAIEDNCENTGSLYGETPSQVKLEYRLLTDDNGAGLSRQISEYMGDRLAVEAARSITELVSESLPESSEQVEAYIDVGKKVQDQAGKTSGSDQDDTAEGKGKNGVTQEEKLKAATVTTEAKQIIRKAANLKKNGILALVTDQVSEKKLTGEEVVSQRNLNIGTMTMKEDTNLADRGLLQAYCGAYFTCYPANSSQGALAYELEYLYGGKDSDRANLQAVVGTLLSARELVNYQALARNRQKQEEARIIAIAIAGALASPEIITVLGQAVLAAWAFMDSLEDVKCLLAGGKIPLAQVNSQGGKEGLSYKEYMQILLATKTDQTLTFRMLDLMEKNLQKKTGNEKIFMDHMVVATDWTIDWRASVLFLNIANSNSWDFSRYDYHLTGSYGYE